MWKNKKTEYLPKKILIVRYGCEEYDYVFEHLTNNYKKSKNTLFEIGKILDVPIQKLKDRMEGTIKEKDKNFLLPYKKELLLKELEEKLILENKTIAEENKIRIQKGEDELRFFDFCIALINLNISGNKYGACLDTEVNPNALEQKHFYLSFTQPGELLRSNNISYFNYTIVALYRDLFLHTCKGLLMNDKGYPRCIFTKSIHERIDGIKFATLYPTISYRARRQIKKEFPQQVELCKIIRSELKRYKPDVYNQVLSRIKARPWLYLIMGILGTVLTGVGITLISSCLEKLLCLR